MGCSLGVRGGSWDTHLKKGVAKWDRPRTVLGRSWDPSSSLRNPCFCYQQSRKLAYKV
jgi:hypothetical protein